MTVTIDMPVDSARIAAAQGISFRRTVDRTLTHHRAVSEVFVTDLVAFDEDTFVAGAQLPRSHSYFLDPAARYGALLLGECSRQAGTYLAHTRYAVPVGHAFLAVRTDFRLYDGPALGVGTRPAELAMVIRTRTENRAGTLHLLRTRVDYVLDGEVVAHSTGGGRYVPPATYRYLRAGERTDALPSSEALRRKGVPVPPALVGRSDARNVLLADAVPVDGGVAARVDVSGTHPTIFDHPQDHYPAMLLADAAAQAAVLAAFHSRVACRSGAQPAFDSRVACRNGVPTRVTRLETNFARYAELDAELGVRALIEDSGTGPVTVAVSFVQYGAALAAVRVTLDGSGS
jgi:2-oxo-3-(phosphooxy)propyl 3-oxoalkanoate synthase